MPIETPAACGETVELLEALVDGELTGASVDRVERHLARCAACRAALDSARTLRNELRRLPSFDAPPGVLREVLELARREATPPAAAADPIGRAARHRLPGRALLAAAATLAALAIGGAVYWHAVRPPSPPEGPAATLGTPDPAEVARAAADIRAVLIRVGRIERRAGGAALDLVAARVGRAASAGLVRAAPREPPTGAPPPGPSESPDRRRS